MHDAQKLFTESGSSPPRRVTLTRITLTPSCTVGTGVGLDAQGNKAAFAADWRPCLALAEALAAGGTVEVTLANWQVVCWASGRRV
jgi:hypothetical protein